MSKGLLAGLLIAVALLGGLFLNHCRKPSTAAPPQSAESGATAIAAPSTATGASRTAATRSANSASAEVAPSALAAAVPTLSPPPPAAAADPALGDAPKLPPETVLENMRTVIRLYGSTFGGNPVGNNAEITKALQGDNPKQINFLKEDGNRVNSQGELVDNWGTPYFFHQLSSTETEIRSAGPDRILWTSDDLVIK